MCSSDLIGATVTSGLTTFIIVPGVDAGIVELFEGINRVGNCKSVGNREGSMTLPTPVTASVRFKLLDVGMLLPAPTILIGPTQISPVS